MKLIDEGFENKKDKTRTKVTIVTILIFLVITIIIGILVAMSQMKEEGLKLLIDGSYNPKALQEIFFKDGKIYVKIRGIAEYLGFESYNGEYNNKSEELSKCYIEGENEVVNFELNARKIYKINLENDSYNYFYLDEPIIAKDGALYTTAEGITEAFNVSIIYDEQAQVIEIFTLPYLIRAYTNKILEYGYTQMSEEFEDTKAILQSMAIVKKTNYGVIDIQTGDVIIEPKYDSIKYMPTTGEFLIESNDKVGVIDKNKSMKVQLLYDSLELMDSDSGLYVARKDNKYGVIDLKGNIKIHIEYDKIGIDATKFEDNGIKNGYILVDNLIPVCKDNLWGMYDKTGKLVVDIEYTNFGYTAKTNKDAINLLVIPNYDVIIAEKDRKYLMLNAYGQKVLKVLVDDIYMAIESGENRYYIIANDKKRDAEKYLDSQGIVAKDENGETLNKGAISNTAKESNETNTSENSNVNTTSENEE